MVLQFAVKHEDGPPSPTLTNPDMILPYSVKRRIATSSPPARALPPNSPPGVIVRDITHQFQHQNGEGSAPDWRGITPRVSPLLGSYGSGTMLPDIEEMDTTPKLGRSRRSSPGSQSPLRFASSFPSMEDDAQATGDLSSKRFSDCSSSGASEDFDFGQWDGFDGAVSVDGESIYQDEEEGDNAPPNTDKGYQPTDRADGANAEIASMIQRREEALSSAALSKRAERILANAKKRLTSMEGNLSRARHSLMVSPASSSMSSSQGIDAEREIPQHLSGIAEWTMSPTKHRQLPPALSSSTGNPGHSRVFSETSVPSSLHTLPETLRSKSEQQRASSAMGSVGMPPRLRDQYGSNSLVPKNRSLETVSRSTSASSRHQNPLQPLIEENSTSASLAPVRTMSASPEQEASQHVSNLAQIDTRFPTNTTLTRSRSTMQMRDLREQMQDLKGKISTLKERARRDNLRRRSLQSLRTPSPFTAADQWHTGAEIYGRERRTTDTGFEPNRLPSPLESEEERKPKTADQSLHSTEPDDTGGQQGTEDAHSIVLSHYETALEQTGDGDDRLWDTENVHPADKLDGYRQPDNNIEDESEEDSILDDQDFYESSPSPIGERHEDRADAFDYEHFFLRSDLGNYGRGNHRRRNSCDSTDSVETTKGPTTMGNQTSERVIAVHRHDSSQTSTVDNASYKGHYRNNSVDSVSTVATFATATEGRGSDPGSDADEEEREQDERQYPMAGTWNQDYFSHHTSANLSKKWASRSHTAARPDSAIRVNGHLTPGSPTGTSAPSATRSFPLVNRPKHLTPSPSPQRPSALLSALLAQVDWTSRPALQLKKEDGDLVEGLLESLGKVCLQLRGDREGSNRYEGRVWRRRVDAARRILDGEIDADTLR